MDTTYTPNYTTTTSSGSAAGGGVMLLIYLAAIAVAIAGMWKVFTKAGQPGWAAIVPFYNTYILCKIAGRPEWFFLLFFVPFVNLIALIIVALDVAKAFGKSTVFAIVGLVLFSPIGFMMLGFGKATYSGAKPAVAPPAAPSTPAA